MQEEQPEMMVNTKQEQGYFDVKCLYGIKCIDHSNLGYIRSMTPEERDEKLANLVNQYTENCNPEVLEQIQQEINAITEEE